MVLKGWGGAEGLGWCCGWCCGVGVVLWGRGGVVGGAVVLTHVNTC